MKKNQGEIVHDEFDIRDIEVFHKLLPDEQHEVLYRRTCKNLKRGEMVYRENSKISGTYLIHSGIIKLFKTGIDGKEQIVRFAKRGNIVGYRSVLSDELACTSAKVIKDAEVSYVPESVLKNLVMNNSRFSMALMRMACHELGDANAYILNIAQKTVRERLAEILILLDKEFGRDDDGSMSIKLTREELANLIGTATESVIRLLSEFKNDRYISLSGRNIRLIEEKKLQRVANVF